MENWPRLDLGPAPTGYDGCFGCGADNPIGLKLKFKWAAASRTASAEFTPQENFQGWSVYLHGGITACVLDEAMGQAAILAGANNVTAKLQVRYRQMVKIGVTYIVSCTVTKQNSRLIETQAVLKDKNGQILAEASSTQFIVG